MELILISQARFHRLLQPAASYCSFAYSAFACFRMGMSGSAFSQIRA
jgi:hypothetical protein